MQMRNRALINPLHLSGKDGSRAQILVDQEGERVATARGLLEHQRGKGWLEYSRG